MTTVDGISVVKWQVYVAGIITRGLLLIVVYFAFRKFTYQFYIKDVVVLSVSFLLAFFVSFLGVYATVNLQLERTIGLDLITTILSMYFVCTLSYNSFIQKTWRPFGSRNSRINCSLHSSGSSLHTIRTNRKKKNGYALSTTI